MQQQNLSFLSCSSHGVLLPSSYAFWQWSQCDLIKKTFWSETIQLIDTSLIMLIHVICIWFMSFESKLFSPGYEVSSALVVRTSEFAKFKARKLIKIQRDFFKQLNTLKEIDETGSHPRNAVNTPPRHLPVQNHVNYKTYQRCLSIIIIQKKLNYICIIELHHE